MLKELFRRIPIEDWINDNSVYITSALLEYRLQVEWMEPVKSNLSNRLLSEMWLCGAFKNIDELPAGYDRISGSVHSDSGNDTGHIFAISGNDVLCITPGQFISPTDNTLRKGDRINKLVSLDPNHIFVRGELAVLYGNIKDIEKSYGLRYTRE